MLIFNFPNANFPLVQVPYHHTTSSLVQFQHSKYDDVPKHKTFIHGHLHMMTFLHLKVYDG